MVYGVEGSERVIRPGIGRRLIESYLEKKARGEIKSEEKTQSTQKGSGPIILGLCGTTSETYTLCE